MELFKAVQISESVSCLIDEADLHLMGDVKWRARKNGRTSYITRMVKGEDGKSHEVALHRLIIGAKKGQIVDHINHCGWDNRKSNLRIVTHSENLRNSQRHLNNASGFKGVFARNGHANNYKYLAVIRVWGKGKKISSFETPEQAARAYDWAARVMFGEFANVNFPLDESVHLIHLLSKRSRVGRYLRGVGFNKNHPKSPYMAYFGEKFLGSFETEKEAALAYDNEALRSKRYTAVLNFPELVSEGVLRQLEKEFIEFFQ